MIIRITWSVQTGSSVSVKRSNWLAMKRHWSSKINEFYHGGVSFPLSVCVCSVSSCLIDLDLVWDWVTVPPCMTDAAAFWAAVAESCAGTVVGKQVHAAVGGANNNNSNKIIYFIHPSGKLKLSFDRTTKNISQFRKSWNTRTFIHTRSVTDTLLVIANRPNYYLE